MVLQIFTPLETGERKQTNKQKKKRPNKREEKKSSSQGMAQMALDMAGGITDLPWWEGILESSSLLQVGLTGARCPASHPSETSTLHPGCTQLEQPFDRVSPAPLPPWRPTTRISSPSRETPKRLVGIRWLGFGAPKQREKNVSLSVGLSQHVALGVWMVLGSCDLSVPPWCQRCCAPGETAGAETWTSLWCLWPHGPHLALQQQGKRLGPEFYPGNKIFVCQNDPTSSLPPA